MNTVLVPLDGSALAERVMPYVQTLAPLLDAKVHLLRVLSDTENEPAFTRWAAVMAGIDEPLSPHTTHIHRPWELRRRHAEGYLGTEVIGLRGVGVAAEATVSGGLPANTIIDFAQDEQATLIAMATHGYSGLKRWTVGSVADQMVQVAPCPVFLVRDTHNPAPDIYTLKRILVPLDSSALAETALPWAMTLAQRANAEVILLQVVPLKTTLSDGYVEPVEVAQECRDAVLQKLTTLAEKLRAQYQTQIITVASTGYVADEIAGEAARRHVDLIVMSTHGYHGLRRWVLGSVADKVLHTTTTPLLVVRPAAI